MSDAAPVKLSGWWLVFVSAQTAFFIGAGVPLLVALAIIPKGESIPENIWIIAIVMALVALASLKIR